MTHKKCFACDKKLGKNPHVADTRDDQTVFVGADCYKKIEKAGQEGYRPTSWDFGGNLRLYTLPKGLSQEELHSHNQKAKQLINNYGITRKD